MDQHEKNQILFSQLVISLHAATMQQLGKLKNPLTGNVERDLHGAQASIDMLEMLRERTKGNLSSDEERLLSQVLRELRLNYVDESNKPAPGGAQPGGEKTRADGGEGEAGGKAPA